MIRYTPTPMLGFSYSKLGPAITFTSIFGSLVFFSEKRVGVKIIKLDLFSMMFVYISGHINSEKDKFFSIELFEILFGKKSIVVDPLCFSQTYHQNGIIVEIRPVMKWKKYSRFPFRINRKRFNEVNYRFEDIDSRKFYYPPFQPHQEIVDDIVDIVDMLRKVTLEMKNEHSN